MVSRIAVMEVVRGTCSVVSGEVALESFFRQSAQEVAAFVSDCYAECQALRVDSESDYLKRCQGSWSIACALCPPSVKLFFGFACLSALLSGVLVTRGLSYLRHWLLASHGNRPGRWMPPGSGAAAPPRALFWNVGPSLDACCRGCPLHPSPPWHLLASARRRCSRCEAGAAWRCGSEAGAAR